MPEENKDLETIKNEYEQLSIRINRLNLLLLGILCIISFTISGAVNNSELVNLKEQVERDRIEARMLFNMYEIDPDYVSKRDNSKLTAEQKWEEFRSEFFQKVDKYKKMLNESLTVKPSLFGTGLGVNLLIWIYGFPFLFLAFQFYNFVQRKKQKLLLVLAQYSFESNSKNKFDRLLFSDKFNKETPFLRYPNQVIKVLIFITFIFLFSYIFIEGDIIWASWEITSILQYIVMIFTAIFYFSAYYYYICKKLDLQIENLLNWNPPEDLALIKVKKLIINLSKIIKKIEPRVSLITGSGLIILSLFLATSASCGNTDSNFEIIPLAGYRLFQGGSDAEWISTALRLSYYWEVPIDFIGRSVYAISIFLSIVTLTLTIITFLGFEILNSKKLIKYLFLVVALCLFIVLVNFSFNTFWFKDELFLISVLCWVVPIGMIYYFLIRERKHNFKNKDLIIFLKVFATPLLINSFLFVIYASIKGVGGILIYYVGILLIFLGYLKLWKSLSKTHN